MKTLFLSLLFSLTVLPSLAEESNKPPILNADDTSAIQKSIGQEVYVDGTVLEAFWVKGNVLMLTFREEKEGFIAVSFKQHREALDEAFHGDITRAVKGKAVRIRGVVAEYKYRPQIVISDPEQIEIIISRELSPNPHAGRLP